MASLASVAAAGQIYGIAYAFAVYYGFRVCIEEVHNYIIYVLEMVVFLYDNELVKIVSPTRKIV